MRTTYLVTYDIRDPKRLRKVYEVLRGFGDHRQLSVFICELTPEELVRLRMALRQEMNLKVDQVLFADLGPAGRRGKSAVESLGVPYTHPERHATIV